MTATNVVAISTNCAACGRVLQNSTDARTGLDIECRSQFDYRKISSLSDADRIIVNEIIHGIAQELLRGDDLRAGIFRIYELGFTDLAKRIERRVGPRTVDGVVQDKPLVPKVVIEIPAEVESVDALRPLPFNPTIGQNAALDVIRAMMKKPGFAVTIVVGYAGTGKTALIQFVAHEHGKPACIAPTGKAALRIRESTGLSASTIHRMIYKVMEDPKTGQAKFVRRSAEEIELVIPRSRLLVLDEASMVGPEVWVDVIAIAQQHNLKLLVIGDGFQLPPVQNKNAAAFSVLLPRFAEELGATRVELTEVLRQAQDSPIIRASMLLRQGQGWRAFADITKIDHSRIGPVALAVYQQAGVVICHRNVTRLGINASMRMALGIHDEMPQPGEPLMVLKNTYEAGLVNGETTQFPGWSVEPDHPERIVDRYKPGVEEMARFGAIRVDGKHTATLAVEELHGRLQTSVKAISNVGMRWARSNNLYCGDNPAPHLSCNFGYSYTGHKSQGSQWPYVFMILEPSIRLDEEDGRRWAYTVATRASLMLAVFAGRIW